MESTEKGDGCERSSHLHGTAKRGVLSERKMGAGAIVIVGVGSEDPAQMGLAQDEDVIEAFPPDRADEPLRMPVPPGRPRGGRVIAYTHRRKALRYRLTVGPISVSDHVVWCFIPREGIGDLTGDPLRRRMGRHRQ